MSKVYLIGTNHDFQIPNGRGPKEIRAFKSLLQDTCDRYSLQAVAEEMSLDALSLRGQMESTCKQVADKLRLSHRYCDPSSATRKEHGIAEDEGDIHLQKLFRGLDDDAIRRKIDDDRKQRRKYWLGELNNLEVFPVLFICGANHAFPFADLVSQDGLSVEVLHKNWSCSEGFN